MNYNELFLPELDGLFYEWDSSTTPGCSLGVIKNGEFLYKKNYGLRDLSSKEPLTSETIFEIASISKQFTAACIALLHLKGKLSLDDSFTNYLPEVTLDPKIKVKHLVYHESGIKDYQYSLSMLNYQWNDIQSLSKEQLLKLINRFPQLDFLPGNQHNYSNTNYFLLGQIIEEVTGKSLAQFAEQEIFIPLGMKNTFFQEKFSEIKNLNKAIGYTLRDNTYIENVPTSEILGPRGVFTTIDDLLLWDRNFYSKTIGGAVFIELLVTPSREKIKGLSSDRWNVAGQNQGYAFGLLTDYYRGSRIIRHGGDTAGFTSEMLRFPDKQFTIIILTNLGSINPSTLTFKTADILLENEFTIPSPYIWNQFEGKEIRNFDAFLGTYYSPEGNTLFNIYQEAKKLILENYGMKSVLKAVSKDTFTLENTINVMLFRFKKQAINIETEYFTADIPKIIPWTLETNQFEEFAGKYTDEIFDYDLQIIAESDCLAFDLAVGRQHVKPIILDTFINDNLQLKFSRDNNEITSVSLNSQGAQNIRYKKNNYNSD